MRYIKTYEAKKKTEDPLYHLAVAMKEYLSDYLEDSSDRLKPIIKYYYSTIRIMNKTKLLNYISIIKSKSTTLEYFNILMNDKCRNIFDEIFNKYKLRVYMDADRYSYADVQNMIDDINIKIAANKYNL